MLTVCSHICILFRWCRSACRSRERVAGHKKAIRWAILPWHFEEFLFSPRPTCYRKIYVLRGWIENPAAGPGGSDAARRSTWDPRGNWPPPRVVSLVFVESGRQKHAQHPTNVSDQPTPCKVLHKLESKRKMSPSCFI